MTPLRRWIRSARRHPRDTLAILVLIAGAVAAVGVVFQTVDRLVLRPLPLPEAHRLLVLGSAMPEIGRASRSFEAFSGPELHGLDDGLRDLGHLLTFDLNSVRMVGGDLPTRLFLGFTWDDPVPALGEPPLLGRTLSPGELGAGLPAVLLSHAAWRREFGEDPTVVGRAVDLDGRPHTVVGVLPPHVGVFGVDAWVPMPADRRDLPADRRQFNAFLRLADGVEAARVGERLSALAPRLGRELTPEAPGYAGWRLTATPLPRELGHAYADEALLTGVGVLLVLLLVAVNVGGLATLRALRERPAIASRLALGASPGRLGREALTEAGVSTALGGLAGLALAWAALELLASTLPGALQPSGRALALESPGIAAGLAAMVLAGLMVAVGGRVGRLGVRAREVLAPGGVSHATPLHRRVHGGLVGAQVALGVVLAAGALASTLAVQRLLAIDPGFDADRVAYMRISLPPEAYSGDAVPLFFRRALGAAASLPGVQAAGLASQVLPSTRFTARVGVENDDGQPRPDRTYHTVVGGDYFATHGIDIVEGRGPGDGDRAGSPGVAVVNEAAARALFGEGTAVGERIRVEGTNFDSGWLEVVGVSRNVRQAGVHEEPAPEVFTVHAQAGERYRQMFLVVRSAGDPLETVPAIRERLRELDPAQPLYSVGSPGVVLAAQTAPRRVAADLLLGFAFVAVTLAAVGLHAALALSLAARRRDLALRAAVGATPRILRFELARHALRLFLPGAVLGVLATLWLGAALRARVGLAADAPAVMAVPAVVILGLAAVAAAWPSVRRAGRTPPAEALRATP